jgi:hypothetical protein
VYTLVLFSVKEVYKAGSTYSWQARNNLLKSSSFLLPPVRDGVSRRSAFRRLCFTAYVKRFDFIRGKNLYRVFSMVFNPCNRLIWIGYVEARPYEFSWRLCFLCVGARLPSLAVWTSNFVSMSVCKTCFSCTFRIILFTCLYTADLNIVCLPDKYDSEPYRPSSTLLSSLLPPPTPGPSRCGRYATPQYIGYIQARLQASVIVLTRWKNDESDFPVCTHNRACCGVICGVNV